MADTLSLTSSDPRDFLLHALEVFISYEELSDEDCDKFENALKEPLLVACGRLGCNVIQDHCRKPEHDFCVYCKQIKPGQAK